MTEPKSREEAIRNGVIVHHVGVDPWEHAQEAMARGCYVQFEFCPPSSEVADAERANDEIAHLHDDYGFTGRHVAALAAKLDVLCPLWPDVVDPTLFDRGEVATSALGQVREALAEDNDPRWREVADLLWCEHPMYGHWALWHAAWQNETLRRRRIAEAQVPRRGTKVAEQPQRVAPLVARLDDIVVTCACGCGAEVRGRFKRGHNRRTTISLQGQINRRSLRSTRSGAGAGSAD